MTAEEKLKEKAFDLKDNINGFTYTPMLTLSDALSICQQEIDEACKKQREICADAFMTKEDYLYIKLNTRDTISTLKRDEILNAPSPKEK